MPEYESITKKFSDAKFLELYKSDLFDMEIAEILNVSNAAIRHRRWRLNLLPKRIQKNSNTKNSIEKVDYNNRQDRIKNLRYIGCENIGEYIHMDVYYNINTHNCSISFGISIK